MSNCNNKKCKSGGAADGNLLACGGCGTVKYCSKDCQKEDWKSGHKVQCWGTKFGAITQAIEMCLLGINSGGKPREQLTRIRSILEQTDALASADGLQDQEHLQNLLMSVYIPPIVQIAERSFAVFSPGVFHGVYPTRDTALQVVTQQYIAFGGREASTICGPHEFMHPMMASGTLPRMNWAEHALIAVYLGMFDQVNPSIDEAKAKKATEELILNKPLSLPRSEIPENTILPTISADQTRILVQSHRACKN